MALMFLNGDGMRGGRAHYTIEGVPLVGERRTAPLYRFYSVRDEFPALYPVADGGQPVLGELYDVPMGPLSALLATEPPELELSIIELDDGEYTLLDRHLSRARNSALYLGFHWIESQVSGALDEAARSHPLGRSRVRLIVDRTGKATVEVHPLERNQERPLAVRFATRPIDERDPLLFHKTTARSRYDAELERCRPCDDVIFWNSRGEVTESTIANVVIFTEGKYWTPPREAGLLAGTLREELISKGELFERTITKRELVDLGSFALINSVRGWMQAELLRNGDSGINGGATLQHSHGDAASFPILIGR